MVNQYSEIIKYVFSFFTVKFIPANIVNTQAFDSITVNESEFLRTNSLQLKPATLLAARHKWLRVMRLFRPQGLADA
jgi:hypothetical protein